jgi:hypothetical protein
MNMIKLTYTKGIPSNPNLGEIRDTNGVLWNYRAVMSAEDDAVMRLMASAPYLLAERDRLRAINAELLAALEECSDRLSSFGMFEYVAKRFDPVIARAKAKEAQS